MKTYTYPTAEELQPLLKRAVASESGELLKRVEAIIDRVRTGGDDALRALAQEIDRATLGELRVSPEEIDRAAGQVPEALKTAIRTAYANIEQFHRAQIPREIVVETQSGVECRQRPVPIGSVGLYIPGGSAPLFSTVLMLAIPARIAGCRRVVLCTPPRKDGGIAPEILWTAGLCGVTEIFKVGGAQAVAAMAYGTESVPCVDKIFGPGNRYVTAAKQLLGLRKVAIDMPAGPSEVMVVADGSADPAFVAADLLSQAEHGADSQAILLTTSPALAAAAETETARQLNRLPRAETARQALEHSRIIVVRTLDEALTIANAYAPEHLILSVEAPEKAAAAIENAGSIFLGNFTPESVGDYASGTNHTLPTAGWARSFSGVNLDSFYKKITIQQLTPEGLQALGSTVEAMAAAEGLEAHRQAVAFRLETLEK